MKTAWQSEAVPKRAWRRARALPAILLAALGAGCATERAGRPSLNSTIGTDRATVPPGQTIPPAGFGVDLVTRPVRQPPTQAAAAERDSAVRRAAAVGDPPPKPAAPRANRPPKPAAEVPVIPPPALIFPLNLTTALRLAEAENPVIGEARARIGEALALQQGAQALLLPTLNAGTNYHGHAGNLQRSSGRILNLSEQSLYLGGGARTLAAETVNVPAVQLFSPLADSLYEPLAARQHLDGVRWLATATANSVLLEVADLYLELAKAEALLDARRRTVADATEFSRLTSAYAKAGQERKADADRAQTELTLRRSELQRGEEEVAVASARLARRLHLDPSVRLHPLDCPIAPLDLVNPGANPEGLIQAALAQRPEMYARGAAVAEAETRFRQERARPLLPTIAVGFSGGAFGGGSNLVPPLVGNFGSRTDFDVIAFWTLRNFGLGNLALQRARRAVIGEEEARRSRTANSVRREVAAALARASARRRQIDVARRELQSAETGYREDLTRAQGAVGLPIEVLDSLDLLARARKDLIRTIIGYDQAQFQLFVALGSPPPLDAPVAAPPPPAPVAVPPAARPDAPKPS